MGGPGRARLLPQRRAIFRQDETWRLQLPKAGRCRRLPSVQVSLRNGRRGRPRRAATLRLETREAPRPRVRGCEVAAKDCKQDRYAETLPYRPNLFHESDFNSGWGKGELKPLAGC